MTPTLPDILAGQAAALMQPSPPEAGSEYQAGRMGIVVMLASLAAQEAQRGPAARMWENEAIAVLLGAQPQSQPDFSWRGLDARNAELRRALIARHEAAEAAGDRVLQAKILELYLAMAKARRLELGG
jgi:hypothetical protein